MQLPPLLLPALAFGNNHKPGGIAAYPPGTANAFPDESFDQLITSIWTIHAQPLAKLITEPCESPQGLTVPTIPRFSIQERHNL